MVLDTLVPVTLACRRSLVYCYAGVMQGSIVSCKEILPGLGVNAAAIPRITPRAQA